MIATHCQRADCGAPLHAAGRGRPRKYCSGRCRVAAHRASRAIPAELVALPRWVRWTPDKRPLQAGSGRHASITAPATWSTHEQAASSPHGAGAGFVLNGDGVMCLDLNHCIQEGRLARWAARILARCPATYVEVSMSGTGLHVFGRGTVRRARVIRGMNGAAIALHGNRRYIATTGRRWRGSTMHLADLSEIIAVLD
ncbi:DNA primase [Amycolatopsis sp. H20-H5]|uniref:DNA primase n=1 Tax=Amycolatopsis sp. H20-H5 TaxID=3046309 RepID=UPI002DBB3B24|nr:DNA primase [Amycolatopsis sp. H20-H5]MEC3975096.1 DNA primase [Amycolatopsis sp. H20-H5]